ncbi:hypothetical protein TrRE_jg9737 [Triparma retinervis]|uniref:Uncharacterized protein n=1 Tax=Triparma retinervis TaxID=2557542 RepID=A0A9W6ZJT8_9STRA|nr:hypothetical protein TrRE_jg9737 [Triparma retinervis]
MWTFGGRQASGVCSDRVHTWSFDDASWREASGGKAGVDRRPAPRFGAQAAFVGDVGRGGSVVMFGGRDGSRNFGDLWIYDLAMGEWKEPVCVGVPPSPRHGHGVVGLDGGRVMVLGGCSISPMKETGVPGNMDELDDRMQAAAGRVEECYRMEREEAATAGMVLESEADFRGWKELARLSAQAAAAVARREKDTADAESDLSAIIKEREAEMHWAKMNSMHGTASLGGVHDGKSWRWATPAVEDTPGAMRPTVEAARTAVRRAGAVLEDERAKALSGGVPGGRSVEVAEAEAVEKVCRWRMERVMEAFGRVKEPPRARYGHTAVAMGQRIYILGGYEEDRAVGSGKEMVALDLEQPDERERRLREEFHARLERERRIQEFKEEQERKQKEYEERVQREKDEKRRKEEVRRMEFEDMLSRLPPKTYAPAPMLKFANKNTIWLKWDPVLLNSKNERLRRGEVTYILYARGGYQHLEKGVRVVIQSGTFDVKYDGGGKEKRVKRGRIRKEEEPEWEVVYRGEECGYAVEASVPDVVLEREEGIQVEMEFVLQTLGTEYPIEEPSLHGEQRSHSTVNRDKEVRGFMDLMKGGEGGGGEELTDQESRAKKKIMEAIEIDGGVIQTWGKGKMVEGTGMGTHFV